MNILSHRIYVGPFNSTVYYPVGKVVGLPFLKLHFIYTALYGGWERTCKFFFTHFPDFSFCWKKKIWGCIFPFSRLFTSVFPTFYFRFPDFLLAEVKSRENGSKKSGKRK